MDGDFHFPYIYVYLFLFCGNKRGLNFLVVQFFMRGLSLCLRWLFFRGLIFLLVLVAVNWKFEELKGIAGACD